MDIKRITSGLLGMSILAMVILINNKYVFDVFIAIVAFLAINEYFNAVSQKAKPIRWLGYLSCLSIVVMHLIPTEYIPAISILIIPITLIISFFQVVITEMKTTFQDVAYTFFGIFYVVFCSMFIALVYGKENNGNILIWLLLSAAWGCDILAYVVGKNFGKHKFSKISPKKSIEGCIAGVIGGILSMVLITFIANTYFGQNYSYLYVSIIGAVLSILSQLGDFAASSIKRYVDIKDYSNLIPGHGGMLDRIDSLIFIAPFAYLLFNII